MDEYKMNLDLARSTYNQMLYVPSEGFDCTPALLVLLGFYIGKLADYVKTVLEIEEDETSEIVMYLVTKKGFGFSGGNMVEAIREDVRSRKESCAT